MKICCERCGRWFDTDEHEGLCPDCGAWNSRPEAGGEEHPLTEQTVVQPAKEQPTWVQQREDRGARWLLAVIGLIAALLGIAILSVPTRIEEQRSRAASIYNMVEEPLITAAQQPDTATTGPYSYRLVDAQWVDYDGDWALPDGCGLLRVELAVSISQEPDWDPARPYLGLPDGSWQLALGDYNAGRVAEKESSYTSQFPYGLYLNGKEIHYNFYYLVPREGGALTLCFERYSVSEYGNRLEEIVELPFTVAGEEASGK